MTVAPCLPTTSRLLVGLLLTWLMACTVPPQSLTPSAADWPVYNGDSAATQYSDLRQIHHGNVGQLELAWRYASAKGQAIPITSELQVNPLIVDGVLYGRNPNYNVFALDAQTGKELWTHQADAVYSGLSYMRGLSLWRQGAQKRLFYSTGNWLFALDANSGQIISSFGNKGVVDLREGLGRDPASVSINAPSPGIVFENLLIMGSAVLETQGAAPGHIRAYDVISGDLVWTFRTIPLPGEFGAETWPADYLPQAGGANAWAGMSLDTERGLLFAPTGSPTPDFDGSKRRGANLFGNSILALDARTGQRRWHFQTVHHDLWDRDLSSPPTLASIQQDGASRDVLIQASKQGVLYVLDRDTGEPVFPIVEQSVSQAGIPGQHIWPTQPKVTLPEPFSRQSFSAEDLSDINPQTHAYVKNLYEQAKPFSYFAPIGAQKTILFPGFYGGGNWGGGAYDPQTNLYYINATEVPALVHYEAIQVQPGSTRSQGMLAFRNQCAGCHGLDLKGFYPYAPDLRGIASRIDRTSAVQTVRNGKGRMMSFAHLPRHEQQAVVDYLFELDRQLSVKSDTQQDHGQSSETAYVFAGYNDFLDQRYYPAVKPPWGTLNAINISTGRREWQVILGEHEELSAEGVPQTGTRNYGGPVVTAGGLLIIAATMDEKLRIFDKSNGELLWEYQLPAAGYATPSTYKINGKQYIVIAASGGKLGTPSGDEYLAFSLPAS